MEIAITISVIAAFASIEVRHALWLGDPITRRTAASTLALLLLPLAWWTLMGRAVHDEALPGDRQFWITRPYSRRSLLGAKILFVLAFINLPMFLADLVIVRAYGLPLGPALPGMLWSQVLLTFVFLLPVFVLSALTSGFVQLIVAILAPCTIALLFAMFRPGIVLFRSVDILDGFAGGYVGGNAGQYEWVKSYFAFLIISAAGSAILLWQYRRRGTTLARCFAVATAILLVLGIGRIPWTAEFKIQSLLTKDRVDLSAAHADYDLTNKLLPRVIHWNWTEQRGVELPLQITGLPPGVSAQVDGFSAEFDAPDGSVRRADQLPLQSFVNMGQHFYLRTTLDAAYYKQVRDEALTVRGELYLTVYGNRQSKRIPFGDRSVLVPQVGVCSTGQTTNKRNYFLICSSAFRNSSAAAAYRFLESPTEISEQISEQEFSLRQLLRVSYSPFAADVGISPVYQDSMSVSNKSFHFEPADDEGTAPTYEGSGSVPWKEFVVGTMEPLGHIRLKFEINSLRLGDFEVHQKPASSINLIPSPEGSPRNYIIVSH